MRQRRSEEEGERGKVITAEEAMKTTSPHQLPPSACARIGSRTEKVAETAGGQCLAWMMKISSGHMQGIAVPQQHPDQLGQSLGVNTRVSLWPELLSACIG